MEKMGYKEGEGLGRNKQGMSVALQVEKTGKRSGRIIHEKDVTVAPPTKDITPQPAELMKNQSKVILLRVRVLDVFKIKCF
jgi:splicing factor 45